MGPNMPSVSASVVCEPTHTAVVPSSSSATCAAAAAAASAHASSSSTSCSSASGPSGSASASCSSAIRDSLASSLHVDRSLQSAVKRTQLQKIEYEPAPEGFHSNVADTLKAKYTVLTAPTLGQQQNGAMGSSASAATSASPSQPQNGSASGGAAAAGHQLPTPKRYLYKREQVQIGWRQAGGRHWATGCGMSNQGNTCYLNSTLQALFHVPAFANWLYSDDEHRKRCEETNSQTECIICAMARTLHDTQTHPQCVKPWRVYSKLRQICRHLMPGHQEDAHEFLRYLVESMEKAYLLRFKNSKEFDQYTKETTPLNQILGGYLKSSVRCLDCGHVSVTFQHFQDLLLDIRKSNSIDEALDTHFARERLEDMGYKCESCKKKVSATKQFSMERAPIALCIQLKRFSMMGGKLNKQISFSPRLNLSKYSARRANGGGGGGGGQSDPQMTYRLVSLVTHLGSSQHCGHYTAVGQTAGGGYYTFDDSSVRSIAQQNVLQTSAYIMFYELEDATAINGGISPPAVAVASPKPAITATTVGATLNGDSGKKSFIGPVCPPELKQAKSNGGPAAESKPQTNGNAAAQTPPTPPSPHVKPVSKLVLNISKTPNTPLNTKWTNSKLVPSVVRNAAASGSGNSGATANEKVKLANPFVKAAATNNRNGATTNGHKTTSGGADQTTMTASATSSSSSSASPATLPSMPNLDLCPRAESSSPSAQALQPKPTQPTTTSATHIAFTAPAVNGNHNPNNNHLAASNGHQHSHSPSTTTPPSSPDAGAKATAASSTTAAHQPLTSAKTNGHHQPKLTNGFVTTKKSNGVVFTANGSGPLVPYARSDDDSTSQSEDDCASSKTPPIVKTKAGVFQVTNAPPSASSSTSSNGSGKRRFVTPDTADSADGNGASVASKLMKMSQLGYGASVSTWGGQASSMDQELKEDRLAEQRRRQEIDVDAEMDAGRQKKVKSASLGPLTNGNGPSNPGYNGFQGTQNDINSGQHKWMSNFHPVGNRKQQQQHTKFGNGGGFGANGQHRHGKNGGGGNGNGNGGFHNYQHSNGNGKNRFSNGGHGRPRQPQ